MPYKFVDSNFPMINVVHIYIYVFINKEIDCLSEVYKLVIDDE